MVFAGLYPVESHQYAELREALEKLRLNDASFFYEPETVGGARLRLPLRLPRPAAHGDRAGAARARIRHGPGDDGAGVLYRVTTTDGEVQEIDSPAKLPDAGRIASSKSRSSPR
jgi:GTP-binding protein LepA